MNIPAQMLLLAWIGGITIPLGALLSYILNKAHQQKRSELNHFITAVGGGALIAGVALVLVPDGSEKISITGSVIAFIAGGVLFMGLDYLLSKQKSDTSQLIAMLSDFIPEAIALGATYMSSPENAILLAIIIGAQNFPEGYNAFLDMSLNSSKKKRKHLLILFATISLMGPACGYLGNRLADNENLLGYMMVFSGSGILYLVFRDIAPKSYMQNHQFPSIGAVVGFLIGLIGHLILHQ